MLRGPSWLRSHVSMLCFRCPSPVSRLERRGCSKLERRGWSRLERRGWSKLERRGRRAAFAAFTLSMLARSMLPRRLLPALPLLSRLRRRELDAAMAVALRASASASATASDFTGLPTASGVDEPCLATTWVATSS